MLVQSYLFKLISVAHSMAVLGEKGRCLQTKGTTNLPEYHPSHSCRIAHPVYWQKQSAISTFHISWQLIHIYTLQPSVLLCFVSLGHQVLGSQGWLWTHQVSETSLNFWPPPPNPPLGLQAYIIIWFCGPLLINQCPHLLSNRLKLKM